MSKADDTRESDADLERLKAFWAGDKTEPFVMERRRFDCDCDVIMPTNVNQVALACRTVLIRVSRMIPPCGLKVALLRLTGMKIGRDVFVSPGAVVDPLWPHLIEIGDGVILGLGCRILSHECTATHFRIGRTRIGTRSVIGAGSTVRAGVTIGQWVTVGCNS